MYQDNKKAPVQREPFVTNLLVKGDTVKEFLNNLTLMFALQQKMHDSKIRLEAKEITTYGN